MEWQPIETVPKDGTIVDLKHRDGFIMRDQWWADDKDEFCGMQEKEFTHWKKSIYRYDDEKIICNP